MSEASVFITYASEGGNAKLLAEDFAKRCQPFGLDTKLICLNDLIGQGFAKSRLICFVSTTGNGEFPMNGRDFYQQHESHVDELANMEYALFELGSRSYSNFCGAGKKLNDLFMQNSGAALTSPVYADEQFDVMYEPWALSLLSELTELDESELRSQMEAFARKPKAAYHLMHKMQLTSPESEQETYHLMFEAYEEGLAFKPGDVVSVVPENEHFRVKELISALQLTDDEIITFKGDEIELYDYLKTKVEISKINPALMKKTGALLNDWDLLSQASNDEKAQILIAKFDVLEWLKRYPLAKDQLHEWLSSLPEKTPRYYSVASDRDDKQLHLCVGLKKQEYAEETDFLRHETGLGSGFLCESLESGETVEFELEVHPGFHLQTERPMIWVATGTGIAPFIGFLAKLAEVFPSERPEIRLYFGVRNPETDFLYQTFLQDCHEQGIIDLKMAFSRTDSKAYVQDLMKNDLPELADSIAKQSHVYVCGSQPMWDEVETVLQHAVLQGCETMEQAQDQWIQFSNNRLHKEIY